MNTFSENGKTYTIEDGRVVAAVADSQEEIVGTPLKIDDRVAYGKKLGSVISLVPTIYGLSAGIKFDDGSYGDYVSEDLQTAPVVKEAGIVTAEGFEAEYNQYEAMEIDTLEEVEAKIRVARRLNLRAKANATNSKNALQDTIFYDHVVTATGCDILDLEDGRASFRIAESKDYLEDLPRFQVNIADRGFGMTGGGDASWLGEAEFESEEISEVELAGRASQTVARLTREQLEDKDFMRNVLTYGFEYLPTDKEARVKFASLVNEARKQKLAENEEKYGGGGHNTVGGSVAVLSEDGSGTIGYGKIIADPDWESKGRERLVTIKLKSGERSGEEITVPLKQTSSSTKTAKVYTDLDGEEFDLESAPIESIFGV